MIPRRCQAGWFHGHFRIDNPLAFALDAVWVRMKGRKDGFLCYAHANGDSPSRDYVVELQRHLSVIPGDHQSWCDQDNEGGDRWLPEIHAALDRAAYAVLFINIEFLTSRFVTEIELPKLREAAEREGLLILPLRVSDCLLPAWLEQIQFLNYEEQPLSLMKERGDRDRIYTAVARRVQEYLDSDTGGYAPIRQTLADPLGTTAEPGVVQFLATTGPTMEPAAHWDVAELANDLSRELARRLERIRANYRCGQRSRAIGELAELIEHPRWKSLDQGLRGRILRTAALYHLVDGREIEDVRALGARAGREDPEGDCQVLAAQIAYRTEGAAPALDLLAAPASPEARHLKAGILIESRRASEALALLEDPESAAGYEAGYFRLRALALLVLRKLPEAVESLDQTVALDPDAFAVRTISALVNFWRACTPAALELVDDPLTPSPFSRALVRSDDRARAALEGSAAHLATAIAQLSEGSREWVHWSTWRLICLLAAGAPVAQTSELTGLLLNGRDPLPLWTLLWAVQYDIPFDRTAARTRLFAAAPDQPDFIVQRGVCYQLCLADEDESPVLADLPATRDIFESAGDLEVWRQWRALALTAAGRFAEARAEVEAMTDENLRLGLRLHIALAEPLDQSAERRLAAADDLLRARRDPAALLEACNAHAAAGDWGFVSEHADTLITTVPTPAALRLLASAAWNRSDYRGCLAALDDHRQVFPGDLLPLDLAHFRVRCQRAIGDLSAAVRDAREVFERRPSAEGLSELLDAQIQSGDREGVRRSLRRMLGLDAVSGDTLLKAAELARLVADRELAVLLWRKATETGSDAPAFAVQAALIGGMIGLGDETGQWFQRMAELAESGTGGVIRLPVSEMQAFFDAQRQAGEQTDGLYRRGEVPVHLLPEGLFPSLSVLFHGIPESNRAGPDPLRQPPVLVRHGARPMQRLKQGERLQGRLVLDITALLTAADLDLFDRIEAQFKPLYLTPNWHLILLDEIRRLSPDQLEQLTEETLSRQDQDNRLVEWVQCIIDRIAAGLKSGTYRIAATQRPPQAEPERPMRGLEDLLHYPGERGDLIWIDDRHLNGYPAMGTSSILGVVEVLGLLRASGGMTKTERFQWLARLRAGNYRYIPLEDDEILHWLSQSRSDGGYLIVPLQLEIIACYWSACLYDREGLQTGPIGRHPHGKIGFVAASQIAVESAIRRTWADTRLNERRRRQRADWLLDRLYVGVDDVSISIPGQDLERDINLPGSAVAMLVMTAFCMMDGQPSRPGSKTTPAERYLAWICERIVTPRLLADPHAVVPAAAVLGRSLLDLLEEHPILEAAYVLGAWTLRFLGIMPESLRSALHKDQLLMQRLGLTEVTVTRIDGLRLQARDLWPAVASALRGLAPIIKDVDKDEPLTLRLVSPTDAPRPVLELANAKCRSIGQHYFEHSEILFSSRDLRLQALQRHPHWWDGHPGGCDSVERLLAGIDSPVMRMERLEQVATGSAEGHYLGLEQEWRRNRQVRLDRFFPPGLDAVLTYVRCTGAWEDGRLDPDRCWDALAGSIPAERGLEERLRRIVLLPNVLPDGARREIRALDQGRAERVLGRLSSILTDPIGRLHLIDLALTLAEVLPNALEMAQAQIDALTTPRFAADVHLVLALVDVGFRAFEGAANDLGIPPRARLLAAWVHAARVAGILLAGAADPQSIAKQLRQWAPFPQRNLYLSADHPSQDLAWPWNVKPADLCLAGLGAILNRSPGLIERLDLTALRGRLARFLAGQPDPTVDLHLLCNPGLFSDRLGCLWGGDRALQLAPLIGVESASDFSPSAFAGRLDTLLTDLAGNPERTESWRSLWVHVREGRLPSVRAGQFDSILVGLDLDALIQSDSLVPLMDLAARHAADRDRIADSILRWAEGIDSGVYPPPGFIEQFGAKAQGIFIERLVHWLHGLASRHPDDPDGEFARLLDGLILRSRTIAAHLRGPLTNIIRHLPYARHRSLRRSLLCARARPEPVSSMAGQPTAVDRKPSGRKRRGKSRGRRH